MRALVRLVLEKDRDGVETFVPLGYDSNQSSFWIRSAGVRTSEEEAFVIGGDGRVLSMRFETHVYPTEVIYVVSNEIYGRR